MHWASVWSVFRYEWRRSLAGFRIAAWCVLALFTPVLIALVQSRQDSMPGGDTIIGTIIFYLVVEVTCLLGLLLWATPAVQSELESNSWIYIAVRPYGRVHLVLGKFANSVVWVVLAAMTAITLTAQFVTMVDVVRFWTVIVVLSLLASLSYGALFMLFAVLFPKRSMVVAVAYTLVFEVLVSMLPATINRLTIQYRLRSLLVHWMGWLKDLPNDANLLLSMAPPWQNVLIVCGITTVLLVAAVIAIQYREYLTGGPD